MVKEHFLDYDNQYLCPKTTVINKTYVVKCFVNNLWNDLLIFFIEILNLHETPSIGEVKKQINT